MFRAQFVKDVAVRIKIDAMDKRVIPDLSVSAEIVEDTNDRAGAITPRGAVFEDGSSKPHVFVRAGSGWQRRDVELGLYNNLFAVVKGDLKQGEVVAIDLPSSSSSNAQVSP
jgi:hypothetical protein